jgi:hypothetical protein
MEHILSRDSGVFVVQLIDAEVAARIQSA